MEHQKLIVINLGGTSAQSVAQAVRDCGVFSLIVPFSGGQEAIETKNRSELSLLATVWASRTNGPKNAVAVIHRHTGARGRCRNAGFGIGAYGRNG